MVRVDRPGPEGGHGIPDFAEGVMSKWCPICKRDNCGMSAYYHTGEQYRRSIKELEASVKELWAMYDHVAGMFGGKVVEVICRDSHIAELIEMGNHLRDKKNKSMSTAMWDQAVARTRHE